MPKRKAMPSPRPETVGSPDEPIGPIIANNLARLGYAETVIRISEIARAIERHTGKPCSPQGVSHVINAVRLEKTTIAKVADSLGVALSDLLAKPDNPS